MADTLKVFDAKSEVITVSRWTHLHDPVILGGVARGKHAGCKSHALKVSVKYMLYELTAI